MNKLTGNKDADFIILMMLNDYELGKVCQANKYVNSLCNDSEFWLNRIMAKYSLSGQETLEMRDYLGISTMKELYMYLKTIPEQFINNDTKKYIPIIIRYLVDQKLIDKIISDHLPDVIPKWFNKEELMYELRRRFPIAVIKEHFQRRSNNKDYWFQLHYKLTDDLIENKVFYHDILKDN